MPGLQRNRQSENEECQTVDELDDNGVYGDQVPQEFNHGWHYMPERAGRDKRRDAARPASRKLRLELDLVRLVLIRLVGVPENLGKGLQPTHLERTDGT